MIGCSGYGTETLDSLVASTVLKTSVPVALIVMGGLLMAAPLTFGFILRYQGRPDTLSADLTSPCLFGGFSLVVGGVLLSLGFRWLEARANKSSEPPPAPPAQPDGQPFGKSVR
jgi:hypothetical protein